MTYQSIKLNTDADYDQEPEFPGTEATPTKNGLSANGWIIDYYDNSNIPQSIFIGKKWWDAAKQDFENRIEHSLIAAYYMGIMHYSF